MRSMALELAEHSIRVNCVNPTQVDTLMIQNETIRKVFCPDIAQPTREDIADASGALIPMPIPWVEAEDISKAVLWLASDAARYITGVALPIDGGQLLV
jgi:(+)-trans-carveol dehydrogenase